MKQSYRPTKTESPIQHSSDPPCARFTALNRLRKQTQQQTETLLQNTLTGAYQSSTAPASANSILPTIDGFNAQTLLHEVFIKNRSILCVMLVIYLFIALLNATLTITIGEIVAHHLDYTEQSAAFQGILLLTVLTITIGVFGLIRAIIFTKYESTFIGQVQSILMKRLFNLPISFFEQYTTGDLCSRVLLIEPLARLSGQNQIGVVLSFTFSILSFLTMLYFTWKLTLTTLAIVSLYLFISIRNIKKQLPYIEKYMRNSGDTAAFTFNMNSGMSRIKVFCSTIFAEAAWAKLYSNGRQKLSQIYRLGVWRYTITNNIFLFAVIVIFFFAARWEQNHLPLAHYLIFYTALIQLMSALVSFSMQLNEIAFTICAFRRLKPILQTATENGCTENNNLKSPPELTGAISINNIQFNYPHAKLLILNGLNCSIAKGEHVAIVGLSGAGKSTLFKLLIGFYFPQQGQISFDNTVIQDLNLSRLREQIGVVFQDSPLMTGTLLTNLIDEDAGMTEEDAWRAAELVGLKEFIASLPMKMHTLVSQQVNVLSGGQKQLILIARALVGKPRILLLDEATNSLDPTAQHRIAKVIRSLPITCICIAHRLSAIQYVDRILVLDKGRIIEEGSYDALLDARGLFYQLTKQQTFSFQNLSIPQKLHRERQENTTI